MPSAASITAVAPLWVVPGGRVSIRGEGLLSSPDALPAIRVGEREAHATRISRSQIDIIVPEGVEGRVPVRVADVPGAAAFLDVAAPLATGVHLVDNPVFDRRGALYATFSGTRSQQSAVTIYKLQADRAREPFVTGIAHPTSLAFSPDGSLYVTDRFESTVYRVDAGGNVEAVASDLGVPCGLAFAPDGALYVGDRSGSIVRLEAGVRSHVASLPPSVVAYHLAWGPDDHLYVAAPTLSSHDCLFRVSRDGAVDTLPVVFGRPQGIAFDRQGRLHVAEALAGSSGVFRLELRDPSSMVKCVSAPIVIGLAFDPGGGLVVASNDALHHLAVAA